MVVPFLTARVLETTTQLRRYMADLKALDVNVACSGTMKTFLSITIPTVRNGLLSYVREHTADAIVSEESSDIVRRQMTEQFVTIEAQYTAANLRFADATKYQKSQTSALISSAGLEEICKGVGQSIPFDMRAFHDVFTSGLDKKCL
jgi:hypothetical protein